MYVIFPLTSPCPTRTPRCLLHALKEWCATADTLSCRGEPGSRGTEGHRERLSTHGARLQGPRPIRGRAGDNAPVAATGGRHCTCDTPRQGAAADSGATPAGRPHVQPRLQHQPAARRWLGRAGLLDLHVRRGHRGSLVSLQAPTQTVPGQTVVSEVDTRLRRSDGRRMRGQRCTGGRRMRSLRNLWMCIGWKALCRA